MPEIRNYVVTQTREVGVTANSLVDAIRIADAAFANGQNSDNGVIDGPQDVWGNTRTEIKETNIDAERRI